MCVKESGDGYSHKTGMVQIALYEKSCENNFHNCPWDRSLLTGHENISLSVWLTDVVGRLPSMRNSQSAVHFLRGKIATVFCSDHFLILLSLCHLCGGSMPHLAMSRKQCLLYRLLPTHSHSHTRFRWSTCRWDGYTAAHPLPSPPGLPDTVAVEIDTYSSRHPGGTAKIALPDILFSISPFDFFCPW